jgi:putative lipoprotein
MSKLKLLLAIAALAVPLGALPVGAQDEPAPTMVTGSIVLPEGAVLPDDATVLVSVDDTSRADAPAQTLSRLQMQAPGESSRVPFALSVLPGALEAHPVVGPVDITILVRIESADGTLLYINDTAIAAVDADGPVQGLVVPVVTVQS